MHQKALNVTVYQNYYKTQMIIHYKKNLTSILRAAAAPTL